MGYDIPHSMGIQRVFFAIKKRSGCPTTHFLEYPLLTKFTYVGVFGWVACGSLLKLDNLSVYFFGTHEKGRKKRDNLGRCTHKSHTESKDQHANALNRIHQLVTSTLLTGTTHAQTRNYYRGSYWVTSHKQFTGGQSNMGGENILKHY